MQVVRAVGERERARCAAIAHREPALTRVLPEGAVAQKDVEDGTDPPDEGDDDPEDLLHAAHFGAPDDVDHTQDPGNRMQKDRQQNLDYKLHHRIACGSRDKKEARGRVPVPPKTNMNTAAATKLSSRSMFLPPAFLCGPRRTNSSAQVPIWVWRRSHCISHTNQGPLRCKVDTSF